MNRNISDIIQNAYGKMYGLDQFEPDRKEIDRHNLAIRHGFYPTVWKPFVAFTKNHWVRITLVSSAVILAVGAAYYFNLMLAAQYDVQAALGNVNALLERRHDTSVNLSKSVYHYTVHESTVLTNIVKMRADMTREKIDHTQQPLSPSDSDKPAKTETSAPADLKHNTGVAPEHQTSASRIPGINLPPLSGLLALAEDHPDLKSSAPFLTLMTSLTDVEKDLSIARLKYNDMVNVYTTIITKFPINIFAKIFGFKPVPYYEASSEATQFRPIDY